MPLEEYRARRRFDRTPEPGPEEAADAGGSKLSYVVQKHDASRLHYDFRLELDGVLESWAVPKGPSLDPADRRLAVRVEAHPLAYAAFEGVIPAGQYGGGPVIVWDRGRWLPEGGIEGARRGLEQGKLGFALEGEKLGGGWSLIRMGARSGGGEGDGRDWLLFKRDDEAARPGEGERLVEERPESVVSGRPLEEVAAAPDRVWRSASAKRPRRRDARRAPLAKARRAPLPGELEPQLATLTAEVPRGERWLHEIKHDGYRALCRIETAGDERRVRFLTRRGTDWTRKLGALVTEAATLPLEEAVLDGEVVALGEDGRSDFGALQDALAKGEAGRLHYQVFDLLHLDGWDLTAAPLEERKALLRELLEKRNAASGQGAGGRIRFSDHVEGQGEAFLRQACRFALEGVISKRRDRPYRPGRGKDWIKTKCLNRQELVVGGFTEPSGSRTDLGALLLGVYDEQGRLRYAGRVGTGFTAASLRDLKRRLVPLERPKPPFVDPPRGARARGVHWVEPELVAEIEFTEWTRDGVLRHPSFQGLREDKAPAEVVRERPVKIEDEDTLKRPSSARRPERAEQAEGSA
ncbi:MAG TPA: non-homologous end-joining DNA ligase, partial [Thermoanaerobaculia bacterium]|nr:non-homologous end-joining DNA ligase [Thermoanaerobaculia bacterium]